VCTIEHAWIPMPDGTKLAARIWLPEDAEAASSGGGREAEGGREAGGGTSRVPAILDFLPYRQGDLMAARDAAIYPYLAACGYACARVDLRGTGNSEGIILDEYTEHYNAGRAHRSLQLRAPNDEPNVIPLPATAVRRRRILGGLLNEYQPAA